jgi:hypothetical protein
LWRCRLVKSSTSSGWCTTGLWFLRSHDKEFLSLYTGQETICKYFLLRCGAIPPYMDLPLDGEEWRRLLSATYVSLCPTAKSCHSNFQFYQTLGAQYQTTSRRKFPTTIPLTR